VEIKRQGEKLRPENEKFRQHIKRHGFVEKRFRNIAHEIEEQIDCTTCANCCKTATVTMLDRDIEDLAKHLRISKEKFISTYMQTDAEEGKILKRTEKGCIFLDGNDCTVYEARPSTCVNFPHMVRGAGSLASRMWQFIDRACYCPIVFNTMEAFKAETKFHEKSGPR
jgi:Fe-S-cluster containining protein